MLLLSEATIAVLASSAGFDGYVKALDYAMSFLGWRTRSSYYLVDRWQEEQDMYVARKRIWTAWVHSTADYPAGSSRTSFLKACYELSYMKSVQCCAASQPADDVKHQCVGVALLRQADGIVNDRATLNRTKRSSILYTTNSFHDDDPTNRFVPYPSFRCLATCVRFLLFVMFTGLFRVLSYFCCTLLLIMYEEAENYAVRRFVPLYLTLLELDFNFNTEFSMKKCIEFWRV